MSRLEFLLSQYAAYHLDGKNIFSHFVGVPLIVFSLLCFTAKAQFIVSGYTIDLALVIIVLSVIYYLSLDIIFGLILAVLLALAYTPALNVAALPISTWLMVSASFFIVGWIIQFIGHFYEKKKPAFVDDVVGLAIGPLFVVAEAVFLLGFRKELKQKIFLNGQKMRSEMDDRKLDSVTT